MSHQGYQALSTKDVVFVEGLENSASLFKTDATLRVKDLLTKIQAICAASGQLSAEEVSILFGAGINCEILRPGATDWASGKLQLNLGFQPGDRLKTTETAIAIPSKTATIEHPIAPPRNTIAPMPTATAAATATAKIDRSSVSATVDRSSVSATVDRSSVSATLDRASVSATVDRASVATPLKADDVPELDLASFTNAILPDDAIESLEEIDHSDVFSLMEDPDVTPLSDDFVFGEGLEGLEGLEFDAEPATKSISSPWDLEELDSMLMVK
jgi:hypothetical protein